MSVGYEHVLGRVAARVAMVLAAGGLSILVAGCNGSSTPIEPVFAGLRTPLPGASSPAATPAATPHGQATVVPSPVPTPSATPVVTAGSMLDPAVANASLGETSNFYNSLPHQNLAADLSALAVHMVATKEFTSAKPTLGGISATLPNGASAIVYADEPENLPYAGTTSTQARQASRIAPQALVPNCSASDAYSAGGAQHEIAFLVNECDPHNIFDLGGAEETFASAFANDQFTSAGYSADVVNDSLDNIVALGAGAPIDYLSIATHGAVTINRDGSNGYVNLSTQAIDAASTATYNNDIMATPPRVMYSLVLAYPNPSGIIDTAWSFTPAFLTENLHFDPGATVYFHACLAANPAIVALNAGQLSGYGVENYYGWTKETDAADDDGTEGFILDRLLGEQPPSATVTATGLSAVAPQRNPPQRPFPIADINAAMAREARPGGNILYTESLPLGSAIAANLATPPLSGGSLSQLIYTPLATIMPDEAPLLLTLPSIAGLSMLSESATTGTLGITGNFPVAQGIVKITDSSGTSQLPVTNWSTTQISATLPADGNGASGMVQVFDATGSIASNAVPLTQWKGTMTYTEGDQIDALGGFDGNGPGAFGLTFHLNFRGDVHPTVQTIDTQPSPQNLYFPQVEGDSTANVTTLHGNFTRSSGTPPPETATLSLNPAAPTLNPAPLPLPAGAFIFGAQPYQPSPCNNGTAGPEGDAGDILCPEIGYKPTDAGFCTDASDNTDSLCGGYATFTPGGSIGGAGLVDPGLVLFEMDPSSYAISIGSITTSFTRVFPDGSNWPASAYVSGSFKASNAPVSSTPAVRSRVAR